MNESPLQLETCFFTEIRVISDPEANEDDINRVNIAVHTEASKRDEGAPRQWFVVVGVKITPKADAKPGYVGEVEGVGMFHVHASWPDNQIERLVAINGASVVYGAIRELISNLTARGPWDMLILPTYSFVEHYKGKFAPPTDPQHKTAPQDKTAAMTT